MNNEQKMVKEFHEKFSLTINTKPTKPLFSVQRLSKSLIVEESKEYYSAETLEDIADALGDLLYVVYGAAVSYGIDLEPIFKEIHRSNMTKVWPDGTVHKDIFGKVVKPETYSKAGIATEIKKQQG